MERSHYSGKAGRHTTKTQYTVNMHGLIIHNTKHSTVHVHDFKVYKTKHTTFSKNLPGQDGSARKGKRANLRQYGDRGYQEAQEMDPDVEVVLPIRCKPGKKLPPPRREGDQQAAVQDPGPCGICDPPGQNPSDHGRQVPEPSEKV